MSFYTRSNQLFTVIKDKSYESGIPKQIVPAYITENIKYPLWFWQKEALELFLTNELIRQRENNKEPNHLMFNMATGTGKTLCMAALILYYYKKGYRHFIFFVNQNNIVDKTENNFVNKNHTKYLFRQNIVIDDKTINIRKVETFNDTDDIQIKFTSIQKLHNSVYLARENSVTLEDLQKRDLVMIGDEAHHLNASTLRNGQMEIDVPFELKENASDKDIEKSWENTVLNKILKKGKTTQDENNKNVLLEFTATIPNNADVIEKYRTKTIYQFELVDFLKAGYTKEINLVSTSLEKKEKILLALLFNWYRSQIALLHITNFKPVILFRSKFIEDSKKDYQEFLAQIKDLKTNDFDFLKRTEISIKQDQTGTAKIYEQGKSRILQMIQFIKKEQINIREIISFIQNEFSERNCIITNSNNNKATTKEKTTENQEALLNSLEDKNNHIRAIFTVKRLTEGWDVLNLFDIVRLYSGRDERYEKNSGKRKTGETTVQEVQLIGRGVRYFPFTYKENEKNKRKFDNELGNPLRVLEEFYYHSENDHRYLDELKRELKNKGFIQENREIKKFSLKKEFKDSQFYKEIKVWKNERIENPKKRKKTLIELEKTFSFEYKIKEFTIKEQQVVLDKDKDAVLAESNFLNRKTIVTKISDFGKHVLLKAINIKAVKDLSLLRFDNLRRELNINSIDEIFTEKFIGNFKINIITSKDNENLDDISIEEKLGLLLQFFDEFARELKEIDNPYKGSDFKVFSFDELFGEPKEKSIDIREYEEKSKDIVEEFKKYNWCVMTDFTCTSEERNLLNFLKNKISNLREKYNEVYLLRNEEIYKIYDFEQGRGFEPDFLLFLKGKKASLYFQIFIEPKGEYLIEHDNWKNKFLQTVSDKYGNGNLLKVENKEYKLIGLPLFNERNKHDFTTIFNEGLLPDVL